MDLGTAIHAGLAEFYTHHAGGRGSFDLSAATQDAECVAAVSMTENFREGGKYTLDACLALVAKGLKEALKTDLLGDGHVVAVEHRLPHMILDLLVRNSDGTLTVIDHKITLTLERSKLQWRVSDYDPSWQLLQYPWGVREYMGETPSWSKAHLVALTPRPFAIVLPIEITDARLDDFHTSAAQHWTQMGMQDYAYEVNRTPAPMNTRSCHAYGRKCDFYELCHVYSGDEKMASALYDRKEPR